MENEKKNQEQPETDSSMSPAHERIKLLANSIKEDSLKKAHKRAKTSKRRGRNRSSRLWETVDQLRANSKLTLTNFALPDLPSPCLQKVQ